MFGEPARARWRLLLVLFFLSGLSGLVYESIWSRYIRLFVGSAATAQILVLSLFMGGMSIGALMSGRFVHRLRTPIVAYGLIEGFIGLYALAFPTLFDLVTRLAYDHLFATLPAGSTIVVAKWIVAGLLILPPCVLLGTTFPLMSIGILRQDFQHSGRILSMLYFTNSFGAALGALLSGFVLVGTVGLRGALVVAAVLNLFIMLVAIQFRAEARPIGLRKTESSTGRSSYVVLYLAVAFGTGLSSFMYEIGWIRLLSMILGSATHSFEVMLSAFVFGLALGGFWVRKRMDRFKRPELTLAAVQIIMGMSAVATLPGYWLAVNSMGLLMGNDHRTYGLWIVFNVVRYALCLLIMLPATFCAGMTLPLLTHIMLKRGQPENAVGNVYGINTLGAIVGAVAAGLLLMPVIGLKGVLVLGALVDLLLGLSLILGEIKAGRSAQQNYRLLTRASMGTAFFLVAALTFRLDPRILTSTVFRDGRTHLPQAYDILSYVDGRTASITVANNTDHPGYHIIYTNGKPDATVVLDRWPEGRDREIGPDLAGDEPNQFLVGLVPLMLKPQATEAALIGFGSGVTCHTLLGSPNLHRLDTIEIEPEMVRGARFFAAVNERAYTDTRNRLIFDDAKSHFAASRAKYDFIVSEPTNPWVSGVSSLFTVEFYREVKRYLKPGGILAQWIQGYELSNELLLSVLAAIDQEFADYLIVRIGSRDWVIVSSADAPIGKLDPAPLSWPKTEEAFDLLGIHDIGQVDGLIAGNRRIFHPFLVGRQPNRDALPLLDTGAEKDRFLKSSAEVIHAVRWTPAPIVEVLGGIERRPYPIEGIGDKRDPHILYETEQAALLVRAYEDPDEPVAETLTTATLDRWREIDDEIPTSGQWRPWLDATYEVYRGLASHLDVTQTAWWRGVLGTARTAETPASIRSAIELLDALSARDGVRLWDLTKSALADPEYPLPKPFLTIAGLIALELEHAEAPERRAYVNEYMMEIGVGDASEDFAYQVLRAYAAR